MIWTDMCKKELSAANLFADDKHYRRFADAVDCYCERNFFTVGLCKCIYMSSFDRDHYNVFLQTINGIVARREKNLAFMKEMGEITQDVIQSDSEEGKITPEMSLRESCMYSLSSAFLHNKEYELPEEARNCGEDWVRLFDMSKRAAKIIQECKDNYYETTKYQFNPFMYQL